MGIVRLIYFMYRDVLQVVSVAAILAGVLGIGYDHVDAAGRPDRLLRRIALAIVLGVVGAGVYAGVPLLLDRYGITPQPGHVKFYGLFFAPAGCLAGILAVVYGAQRWFFAPPAEREPRPFFWKGYLVGLVILWILFFAYSRVFLDAGILVFALLRSTITAAVGAVLFAAAPFLVRRADKHAAGLFTTIGYLLIVARLVIEIVLRMTIFFRIDLL
jgi:hypothetical protein